jgi:hypothetical protein
MGLRVFLDGVMCFKVRMGVGVGVFLDGVLCFEMGVGVFLDGVLCFEVGVGVFLDGVLCFEVGVGVFLDGDRAVPSFVYISLLETLLEDIYLFLKIYIYIYIYIINRNLFYIIFAILKQHFVVVVDLM